MSFHDLQLDWVRAFVAVVDAGSLTAAAPLVHRSQSALSMQLKKLEEAVGRPVLSRGPRHLELTPTGAELLGHARRLLEVHAQAQAAMHGPALTGRVSMGVPDDYVATYMTPVLRSFAMHHARVEITLVCEQSTELVPKVSRGEIDLALISRDRANRGTLLFREPLVWVGTQQHEAWRRTPLPVAAYEPGSAVRRHTLAALASHRRDHRVVYNSASLTGQLAAVESGLAVAVLTRCSVPPGMMQLQGRHGLPDLPSLEVAVLRSKTTARSDAVSALFEEVLRTLRRPI
ncbi:MAG TPA: LysR family transcriptional regulator [Hydrogenophaga sp.]